MIVPLQVSSCRNAPRRGSRGGAPGRGQPRVDLIAAGRAFLAAFGSVLRPDFSEQSDVDLLVEFEPGRVPGLLTIAAMEIELGEMLGRGVDLRTAGDLSRYFRDRVAASARELYAA